MVYNSFNLLKKIKKPEALTLIHEYYESIGRQDRPPIGNYSLEELKRCLVLFNIELTYQEK